MQCDEKNSFKLKLSQMDRLVSIHCLLTFRSVVLPNYSPPKQIYAKSAIWRMDI